MHENVNARGYLYNLLHLAGLSALNKVSSSTDNAMPPTPDIPSEELHHEAPGDQGLDADAVVISGISAAMPNSHDLLEFADQLYDKARFMSKKGVSSKYKQLLQAELNIFFTDKLCAHSSSSMEIR